MSQQLMRVDDGGGREKLMPVDYPSNSRRNKEKPDPPEKPKIEQIVTGDVVQRKKGFGRRVRDSFVGEKGVEGMIDALITDILVGALKGMISDVVDSTSASIRDGVNRLLYGDVRRTGARYPSGYTSYHTVRQQPVQYGTISQKARVRHDFNDVIIATRGEAEDVLDALRLLIDQFGQATVADYYELVGITGQFTDENWGWYELRNAMVRNVRGGYLISLPRTQPID